MPLKIGFLNMILGINNLIDLLKKVFFYAFTNGINRGLNLIIYPVLISFLSVDDYGVYNLTLSVSNLLVPILTISGTAGILREVTENPGSSIYLLHKFSLISTVIVIIILGIYYIINGSINWFFYSVLIGYCFSILELNLNNFRALLRHLNYGILIFTKSVILILVVFFGYKYQFSLYKLLTIYTITMIMLVFTIFIYNSTNTKSLIENIEIKKVLKYTVYIVPHGLSLWVINSSDKYFIKYFINDYELGIYSIAYTIASIQFLINSGISIALPQLFYKSIRVWSHPKQRIISISCFLLISLLFVIFYSIIYRFFPDTLATFKIDEHVHNIIKIILPSLILVGCYQFYSIFIFYKRDTKKITKYTFIGAIFNVILNIIFIPYFGIIAAAYSTLITYIFYFASIYLIAYKDNYLIKIFSLIDIFLISFSVTFAYFIL